MAPARQDEQVELGLMGRRGNNGRQYAGRTTPVRLYRCLGMVPDGPGCYGAVLHRGVIAELVVATTLPQGALAAVVSGDPNSPGESTFLLSMPNGYRVPPHFHPSYEHVEVRSGTLLVGMGDELDRKRTRALVAGDSATAPAGMHHFWIASGRTEVSVTFNGPYTITYLRAEDAPWRRVFPF
jgi:quercetin dioxygenase-like cupin family protein